MKNWIFYIVMLYTSLGTSQEAIFRDIEDTSELSHLNLALKNRKIGKIELKNGLQAYLISDPNADQSAAALAVGTGSWDDPKEYAGMAHLLEHMLFMGTEKYPEENDFMKFASDHGGSSNAYTSIDRTVYMFAINNDHFLEGLDRFSHFFIDPLFNPSSLSKELFNVDQEHAKNIENDNWRAYMISKETGNQNHPHKGFSTGNSQTLSEIPSEVMRSWYEKNYSAQQMKLVIYSPLPLGELKKKVTLMFYPITSTSKPSFTTKETLSSSRQIGHMIYIKPIKDLQKLSLTWEVPSSFVNDDSKSLDLIAYALLRGQKHSLSEILKNEKWIDKMRAGAEQIGTQHMLFQIEYDLTNEGLQNINSVLQRSFQALRGLTESGIPAYLFQEMNQMNKLDYQYQSRTSAFSTVSYHAALLHDEALNSYPKSTLLAKEYSPRNIHSLLHVLTPRSCQYVCMASPEKTHVFPTQKEKWLGGEYAIVPMNENQLSLLENVQVNSEIKLAHPNPFQPSTLEILEEYGESKPIKLVHSNEGTVFFLKDDEFQSPIISHYIHIKSPLINDTTKSQTFLELYLKDLSKELSPLISCAKAAGLSASCSLVNNTLTLHVQGYSDKAPLLLEEFLKQMVEYKAQKDRFNLAVQSLRKNYENGEKELPVYQAYELLSSLIKQEVNTKSEKREELLTISFEDYQRYVNSLFDKTYIDAFFSGNLSLKDAESSWLDIQHILTQKAYPKEEHSKEKVLTLSDEGPFFIKKESNAAGNAAILLIDEGNFSFSKRASQTVLNKVLQEAFFSTLRTKQKTAYITHTFEEEKERRLYQYLMVQSNTHDPIDLIYRFELFLEDFLQELPTHVSQERFKEIKQSQITLLSAPRRNLIEKTSLLDHLAFSYHEDFKWLDKRIEGLKELTYEQFIEHTELFLTRQNKKRLAILYFGKLPANHLFSYEKISSENLKKISEYEGQALFDQPVTR